MRMFLIAATLMMSIPMRAQAATGSAQRLLSRIGVDGSANIAYLWAQTGWPADLGGDGCNPKFVAFNPTTEMGKAMLATATAAYLANKQVLVYVAATAGCSWQVTRIDIVR